MKIIAGANLIPVPDLKLIRIPDLEPIVFQNPFVVLAWNLLLALNQVQALFAAVKNRPALDVLNQVQALFAAVKNRPALDVLNQVQALFAAVEDNRIFPALNQYRSQVGISAVEENQVLAALAKFLTGFVDNKDGFLLVKRKPLLLH